jgi:hypothetical protein
MGVYGLELVMDPVQLTSCMLNSGTGCWIIPRCQHWHLDTTPSNIWDCIESSASPKRTLCGIVSFKLYMIFFMCFAGTPTSLVLILQIPAWFGVKGDCFFQTRNFFGIHFTYKLVYYNLYHMSTFTQNWMLQICMYWICISFITNWYNTFCIIQIVLCQFIIKLREICPKTVTLLLFFLMDNHQNCSNPITSPKREKNGCIQWHH